MAQRPWDGGSGRRPELKLHTPRPLEQRNGVFNSPLQPAPVQQGPFNPAADISGGLLRVADANDDPFGVPAWPAPAPEYSPAPAERNPAMADPQKVPNSPASRVPQFKKKGGGSESSADRVAARKRGGKAIRKRIGDNDSGKAWLE